MLTPLLLSRTMPRKVTLYEGQSGLLYHRGKFQRELPPGYYNFWWSAKYGIRVVDMRLTSTVVASQEILTNGGIPIKVSIVVSSRVEAARAHIESSTEPYNSLYADIQIVLRDLIGGYSIDDVMTDRTGLNERLTEQVRPVANRYAIKVESALIRDVTVSGEIKKAFSDVLRARKAGEAALERARGETAALRNLANAAKLVDDLPALLQIRSLQVLAESPGSSLVLGADSLVRKAPPGGPEKPKPTRKESE